MGQNLPRLSSGGVIVRGRYPELADFQAVLSETNRHKKRWHALCDS